MDNREVFRKVRVSGISNLLCFSLRTSWNHTLTIHLPTAFGRSEKKNTRVNKFTTLPTRFISFGFCGVVVCLKMGFAFLDAPNLPRLQRSCWWVVSWWSWWFQSWQEPIQSPRWRASHLGVCSNLYRSWGSTNGPSSWGFWMLSHDEIFRA